MYFCPRRPASILAVLLFPTRGFAAGCAAGLAPRAHCQKNEGLCPRFGLLPYRRRH
jgi:hypothetical protein